MMMGIFGIACLMIRTGNFQGMISLISTILSFPAPAIEIRCSTLVSSGKLRCFEHALLSVRQGELYCQAGAHSRNGARSARSRANRCPLFTLGIYIVLTKFGGEGGTRGERRWGPEMGGFGGVRWPVGRGGEAFEGVGFWYIIDLSTVQEGVSYFTGFAKRRILDT